MLMVVFGAGASYDSFAEHPPTSLPRFEEERPPLAAQLFDERFSERFSQYPECLGLFPQLRRAAISTGVEQRLAELVEQSANDFVIRQQMLALRFYIRDVIAGAASLWQQTTHGSDNYAELLDRIDRWRRNTDQQVALVTFNYDVLLDQAAATLPVLRDGFASMKDYISREEYRLLKVHGSTDWLRLVSGLGHTRNSYRDAIDYVRNNQIAQADAIVTSYDASQMGKRSGDIPAIAIPIQEKSTFEMPQIHMEALEKCIDATTDLIIVGWKGMEGHFLDLWHARVPPEYPPMGPPHLKRVLIVDKSEGTQIVEGQLRNVALMDVASISIESLTDGFTGFLGGDRLETFLSGVLLMPDRSRV